jgi:transcriptional regulator with XRE-family HTH domain
MSQRDLAAEVGRSESWVSQVERGARSVDRLSVLQQLADVLGIPLADLQADTAASPPPRSSDIEQLRLLLVGHPALGPVLTGLSPIGSGELAGIDERAHQVWPLVHDARYDELQPLLMSLIPDLEQAARRLSGQNQAAVFGLLSQAYQVAAAVLTRLGESDAAWVAADRAVLAAERAADPLAVVAGLFRMAHAFMGLRQLGEAQRVASQAVAALDPRVQAADTPPEEVSLYGAMHLVLAVIAARDGHRSTAHDHLDQARTAAARLGENRNDYGTEFGPANVEIHAVSVAVDLGDAGEAIELARHINVSGTSPERQFRLNLDAARAEMQRQHIGEAVKWLTQAEHVAPEHFRGHPLPRETIRDLMQLAGRHVPSELRELASRTGLLPP